MLPRRISRSAAVFGAALVVLLIFYALDATSISYQVIVFPPPKPPPQFSESKIPPASNAIPAAVENGASGRGRSCPRQIESIIRRQHTLRLTDQIVYSHKCLRAVLSPDPQRDTVTSLSQSLISSRQSVTLSTCSDSLTVPACEEITLELPPPYPHDGYGELLFGVTSSSDRLRASVDTFAHWLSSSGARLLAYCTDGKKNPSALRDLSQIFAARNISAEFIAPDDNSLPTAHNHFAIIRALDARIKSDTNWIGLIDDDTFFPSLHRVADALSPYDHTEEMYVGAPSEDARSNHKWGTIAFGGAGIFLSRALVQTLAPRVEDCLSSAPRKRGGDGILRDCIREHTKVELTVVDGLHQVDIRGDVSGFFESGVNPISLHHWKSWYTAPVDRMGRVVEVCGPCFLQRWLFGGDTLFTNGYSIAVYGRTVDGTMFDRTEETWISESEAFEESLGPLRDKETKKSYVLQDAWWEQGTSVFRQVYVLRGRRDLAESDEVVDLEWRL